MPVQFPQVQDRVGDFTLAGYQGLGAGIGGGLRELGEAIEKRREETKRLNTAGKASKQFLKAIAESTGQDPHEIDAMSAADAIAHMTGMSAAENYKKGVMDSKVALQRIAASEAKTKLDEDELSNLKLQPVFGREYSRLARQPQPPSMESLADFDETGIMPEAEPPLTGAALAFAAAEKSGHRLSNTVLGDVLRLQAAGGGGKLPRATKLAGRDVVFSEDTGAFQVLPTLPTGGETSYFTDPVSGEPVPGLLNIGGKPVAIPQPKTELGEVRTRDTYNAITQEINALAIFDGVEETKANKPAKDRLKELRRKRDALELGTLRMPATPDPQRNALLKAEAQRAIDRGADPAAVKARLKELGVE